MDLGQGRQHPSSPREPLFSVERPRDVPSGPQAEGMEEVSAQQVSVPGNESEGSSAERPRDVQRGPQPAEGTAEVTAPQGEALVNDSEDEADLPPAGPDLVENLRVLKQHIERAQRQVRLDRRQARRILEMYASDDEGTSASARGRGRTRGRRRTSRFSQERSARYCP